MLEEDGGNTCPTQTSGKTSGRLTTLSARRSCFKVWRSRVTEAEIAAGLISPLEAYGSEVADKLAAKGALRNALTGEYVAATWHTDSRVRLVQTRLVEVNLRHVQNKPKIVRAAVKAPVRRTEFGSDMTSAVRKLEKGDTRSKCRRCLIRGDRLFLKRIQGAPCSARPHDARPLSAPVSTHPASSLIDEPESFFIGDTPSSEDDPFGWRGDVDQDHNIIVRTRLVLQHGRANGLTGARLPPSSARGQSMNLGIDPSEVDDDRPGPNRPGTTDSPHDGIGNIAMDLLF